MIRAALRFEQDKSHSQEGLLDKGRGLYYNTLWGYPPEVTMAVVQATNTSARVPPQVVDELCQGCAKCAARAVCKTKALVQVDPGEAPLVDGARCYGCYKCVPACPYGAITIHSGALIAAG